ncbi:MAG: histidine phosphatase family protein [Lachnospiraceae bacterium]|nr:histidine phosphatase family protein [Lachnospiraceae bacterium]
MSSVYFIRHAEPDYSISDDYLRCLTEEGHRQAWELTLYFQNIHIDRIISSPYLRAIQTMEPVARMKGMKIETDIRFRERKSAGLYIPEDMFKGFAEKQWSNWNFKYEGGESIIDVRHRYSEAFNEVISQGNQTVLIGSHITGLCAFLTKYGVVKDFADFSRVREKKPWVIKITTSNDFTSVKEVILK